MIKLTYVKCEICDKNFENRNSMIEHIASVHEEKKFVTWTFPESLHWKGMLYPIHDGTKPFKCDICGKMLIKGGSFYAQKGRFKTQFGPQRQETIQMWHLH